MGPPEGGLRQSDLQGNEEVSTTCKLELVDVVPQREALAEDVHPSCGCESCEFKDQLLHGIHESCE